MNSRSQVSGLRISGLEDWFSAGFLRSEISNYKISECDLDLRPETLSLQDSQERYQIFLFGLTQF